MNDLACRLASTAWEAITDTTPRPEDLAFTGSGDLPSAFAVTDLASGVIASAALAAAALLHERRGLRPVVTVDRRLASFWFGFSIRPIDWTVPPPWDPIAGDYPASDGWIRLHTNAPPHRAAALRVLGVPGDRDTVARVVAGWRKSELEAAVVEAGGCAAQMLTRDEWRAHPQGKAVATEPLVLQEAMDQARTPGWSVPIERPLEGIRVLDLTRVLAGPVASRFLAGYGAEVLRIDPPGWDEPGVVPEVTLGKRCARLDLRGAKGRATFEALLSGADVVLHGYRPGALAGLGFDDAKLRLLSPGLIDVSLDAYGWSGPWAGRRGFDSLVQMSTGIADAGMRARGAEKPVPLPVQALDHATGYLMAATAIGGITQRLREGIGARARLSLARTAELLLAHPADFGASPLAAETEADWSPVVEATEWGDARRIAAPVRIGETPMRWKYPACSLGSVPPEWPDA